MDFNRLSAVCSMRLFRRIKKPSVESFAVLMDNSLIFALLLDELHTLIASRVIASTFGIGMILGVSAETKILPLVVVPNPIFMVYFARPFSSRQKPCQAMSHVVMTINPNTPMA